MGKLRLGEVQSDGAQGQVATRASPGHLLPKATLPSSTLSGSLRLKCSLGQAGKVNAGPVGAGEAGNTRSPNGAAATQRYTQHVEECQLPQASERSSLKSHVLCDSIYMTPCQGKTTGTENRLVGARS